MKKSKESIPAHTVIDLMAQGIFVNQGHLRMGQMERKMKAAQQQQKKGGE